jgi:hypothetical protein
MMLALFHMGQWLSRLRQLEVHLRRIFGEPTEILGGYCNKEADLSEKMNDIVSRRKTFSLLGLAAAALALAVPTTVLTVVPEEAEAQTAGMQRRQARRGNRQERRQVRRTARVQRRAIRRGVVPAQ